MAERSEISWTDATFNWWEGCTKVGLGCDGCYAEARNKRFGGGQAINWGPGAPRRLTSEHNRNNIVRWNRKPFYECEGCGWRGEDDAESSRQRICMACGTRLVHARRRVFCSSLSDLFDNEVAQSWRDEMFAKGEACTNLDFLFLTKRIGNVRKMVPACWLEPGGWPAHIRLGITVVTQPEADRDIPKLVALGCPNFLSMEPLLAAVAIWRWLEPHCERHPGQLEPDGKCEVCEGRGIWGIGEPMEDHEKAPIRKGIGWVIVGGESGHTARPMHPRWPQYLQEQCEKAGVPFHFKQWGEFVSGQQAADLNDCYEKSSTGGWVEMDGSFTLGESSAPRGEHAAHVFRLGKKLAGRLLDGRTHDGFPGGAA